MNENSSVNLTKDSSSTKDLIVERANEIINNIGMMDFRIDLLAKSLKISPGNITYHFARKDDISNAIWIKFYRECAVSVDSYITPVIDVKQLFLLFRFLLNTIYSYRGVVSCMLGDSGIATRERRFNREMWNELRKRYKSICSLMVQGGYINDFNDGEIEQLCFDSQTTILGWWVPHSISSSTTPLSKRVDYYALLALMPLRPFLTHKGSEQLNALTESIN